MSLWDDDLSHYATGLDPHSQDNVKNISSKINSDLVCLSYSRFLPTKFSEASRNLPLFCNISCAVPAKVVVSTIQRP